MRRALLWFTIASLCAVAATASALARNPVDYLGAPMSCPDPDVFNSGALYIAACTSDFGQDNPPRMSPVPAAFPLYVSSDLQHWRFVNFVFPPGTRVNGALPPEGAWPGGEFWSPEIHKIGTYWVAYFGAQIANTNRQMGLFVAWTRHLFGGRWDSKLLYRGGGVIDPSVAWVNGQLQIVYCRQPRYIYLSRLTPNGLNMLGTGRQISQPTLPWENDSHGHGVEEGPVLWRYHGVSYVLYNAASTWDNTYKIGVLVRKPDGRWVKDRTPVLQSGSRLVSVGIGAQPFVYKHRLMLAFHVQFNPATHAMEGRYLSFLPLRLSSSGLPYVPGGKAYAPYRPLTVSSTFMTIER